MIIGQAQDILVHLKSRKLYIYTEEGGRITEVKISINTLFVNTL
jgi:tRNA pseudouridine-54 N-methylase